MPRPPWGNAPGDYFAERVFGDLPRAALADGDRLKRTVANIERRQAAVLRQAMGDPH
ncbi:hypothetical protein ACWED2_05530 [Amycolatopsis sp. NPDC005003]